MIYNFTSSKAVIAKVYRDFKPTIPGWEMSAYEWIGECIEAMECSAATQKTSTPNEDLDGAFIISSHKHKLPCNLVAINAVEYCGRNLPYGGDQTGYSLGDFSRTTKIYSNQDYQIISNEVLPGNSKSTAIVANSTQSPENIITDYYLLNAGYIITSFSDGFIKVHYEAYPIDEYGFPFIPDHYYVKTAMEWYIISRLILLGYKHPDIDFNSAERRWFDYKLLAQNKLTFPSIGQMERLRNMWVRLVPLNGLPDDFFAGGESKESIKYI